MVNKASTTATMTPTDCHAGSRQKLGLLDTALLGLGLADTCAIKDE